MTLGPLWFDVDLAHKALAGFGTNEMLLTELILGRSGGEIRLLIEGYRIKHGKDLVSVVKSDLSGKIERSMILLLNAMLCLKLTIFYWFSVRYGVEWSTSP